jgi:precorrin-3B C17-methyltransferase
MTNKIYVVGIGPGSPDQLTPQAQRAIESSDVVVGYKLYLKLISELIGSKETRGTGMKKERDRAIEAFELAKQGKVVAVISSGDSGVYGMASLMWEMKALDGIDNVEIEVVPGISAMFAAAALLGAPLGHDFCSISLSDLLTPWQTIENRIEAAAKADFVTAIYNPHSTDRYWQLSRLKEIFLQHRSPATPVGLAHHVGRPNEHTEVVALADLEANMADMFTVVIIGNSQSFSKANHIITPRGYYTNELQSDDNPGRAIMNESFKTILSELDSSDMSLEKLWVALHCIHTTADFNMARMLYLSEGAIPKLHSHFYSSKPPVIITDVRMVGSGIRKAIVDKLGIEVKCYLDDPRTDRVAKEMNTTRTQAGVLLAVNEHPDALYAFGNAPTALIELTKHIRRGVANPCGVIAAPVGFVNVKESKWRLKYGCSNIPCVIVEGRKGGSNVAATIINAILSWSEAEAMHPGEGV